MRPHQFVGLKRIVRIFANNRILLNRTNTFRGSNSRWQRLFHFSAISTETLHSRTLPHARWPPDRDRRNGSNQPTQPGSSYHLPVLLKAALFLLFDWSKKRSDDPYASRSMAFRLRRYLELFPRTPLHRLVSVANSTTNFGITWSWIFPVLHCNSGDSKDKQSTSIEKKRWKVEWTYRPGAVHRQRDWTELENVRRTSPWKLRVACSNQTSEKGNKAVTSAIERTFNLQWKGALAETRSR